MDNAKIHRFILLQRYLVNNPNIKVIYNVPYSPESNPIEFVFNDLKSFLRKYINIKNNQILNLIQSAYKSIKINNINQYYEKSLNFYNFK